MEHLVFECISGILKGDIVMIMQGDRVKLKGIEGCNYTVQGITGFCTDSHVLDGTIFGTHFKTIN